MKCVKGIRATREVDARGRIGGAKRLQRNNFWPPWKDSCRKLRGGGDWERESRIRIQREVVLQNGKSVFWDGDRRRQVGLMTSCGRRRCWYGDRRCPGGRMNLCGS